jgi:hypothetical protein
VRHRWEPVILIALLVLWFLLVMSTDAPWR